MSANQAFDNDRAIEYINNQGDLFPPDANLSCNKFSNDKLYLVFRITDQHQRSVILKQARPDAHDTGAGWPQALERARIEASTLRRHGKVCPAQTVRMLHHDSEQAIIILEDLGHLHVLRTELNAGRTFANLGRDAARYLATTSFYHSDFYLAPEDKKALIQSFTNPQLCSITETVFFDDPYRGSARDPYTDALHNEVNKLRQNTALKLAVARLRHSFQSSSQTLVHGNIHSGSLFVDDTTTKFTDPKFAFFGPIGLDLGCFIGNLLLNFCAQHGRIKAASKRRDMHTYLLRTIDICLSEFEQQWVELCAQHGTGNTPQAADHVEHFVRAALQDAVGYCGSEMIRRITGQAQVSDLDEIEDAQARLRAQRLALEVGQQLILHARSCQSKNACYQLIISVLL
ncbi:S-methyl-5-thioribose kinase [Pseudoalteromonas sp. DL2-H2.2]|uniref:S-methyl-5-thioribose kinase n=1 Tax=Pseudoalteromonas sp. DL2-H2.2 TaxID=2908889 RepID=UPI001F375934|nr:S-methyl-5-thioribose kinase [Pseudoalteromonas sp. DL2-H2.2]MCF2911035.1 S-methyl-5-thioribose kinase [Pseudoalteromonas sp. DL2-H2.2]